MKPCAGCKHDSKTVICTHPDFNNPDFFDPPPDENGFPPCYQRQSLADEKQRLKDALKMLKNHAQDRPETQDMRRLLYESGFGR